MTSSRLLLLLLATVCLPGPVLPVDAAAPSGARLLRNGEYHGALVEGIRSARKSVICSFFLFKTTGSPRNLPRQVAEELVRARKRGVDVTVVLEQDDGRKGGVTGDNRDTAALLLQGGVKVIFDRADVVTHTKTAVIDGRYVYLGSHNLTQSALKHNNELSVVIESPELAGEVGAYLERL